MRRFAFVLTIAILATGCASARIQRVQPEPALVAADAVECADCGSIERALRARSNDRVAELKQRGGECAAYGSVLESSMQSGRVTIRPFMWRVDGRLVSGEARSGGDIVVARHIDPLNIGVRTVDDMVRSLEHEAAHVTFRIANDPATVVDDATDIVRACRDDGRETRHAR